MKFVDQIRVHALAGDGGKGCVSFRREKFVPRGGPNGGDGGDGGDIVLIADVHTDNLVSLFFEPIIRAEKGGFGQGKDKHGKSAPLRYVKVPVGTLVYRLPEAMTPKPHNPEDFDETPKEKPQVNPEDCEMMADLTEAGQEFVLCKGGKGGKGNTHFKSSKNRAPRQFTPGEEGEEGWFLLELRTIAFAGLVGFPNAGKSTLLGKLSSAHPKVASYPFTTLNPVVGVVEYDDFQRLTVADIPGLIEGASENKGLGHEFLRHIVRCKLLLFVVDMAGSEGRDPLEDFKTLRKELDLYDPTLSSRPWAVVANKMDLEPAAENLKRFKRSVRKAPIIPISADKDEGVAKVREFLREELLK
ncbi:MAG: GTPase ObgE [Chthoniobacterales bacterium]